MSAIHPFLALNVRNGTPQAKQYVNATPTFFGGTFGTADVVSGVSTPTFIKGYVPIVRFGGSSTFLATVGNQVYQSTNAGTSWTSVYTMSTLPATVQNAKTGLWVIYNTGTPTVVLGWSNETTATVYFTNSTNGTSWAATVQATGLSLGYIAADTVVWDGNLVTWWAYENGSGAAPFTTIYSPSSNSISSQVPANNGFNISVSMCVFQNRCFAVVQTSSGTALLNEMVAGSWVTDATMATGLGASGINDQAQNALFTDGTNMYAFFYKGSTGWQAYQITSALVVTNITSSVMPAVGLDTSATTSSRWKVVIDCYAVPGSASIWLYYALNGTTGTNWTEYQWNGNASLMTLVQTAGDVSDAMPFVRHSQGTTFWVSGENMPVITGFAAGSAGNITVSYVVYSDSLSGTCNIQGYFGTNTQAFPLSPATINGVGGGQVTGVPMNGTTQTLTWNAQTDGFTPGALVKFILEQD
jgi:hypothetical protein